MAKQEKNETMIHLNDNLSTPWADGMNIAVREDNILFIRFSTSLPEGIFEQARLFTSKDFAIKMADILCKSLDYYPVKDKKAK